jgi:hypothetical protein
MLGGSPPRKQQDSTLNWVSSEIESDLQGLMLCVRSVGALYYKPEGFGLNFR